MPKSASVVNTWDAVIRATDASIEELSMQMYREPKNATMYQQSITILMLRKQEAIIRKKMGEQDVTKELYQEIVDELAANAKYLASDIEFHKVSPTRAYSEKILERTHNMHEALNLIEKEVRTTNAAIDKDPLG